ncbi:hypothetical protein V1520DRAFT_261989, partial [Lipomyces starkeyi]
VALIATNRSGELKPTLGRSSCDVSHLCHNGQCFNSDHLIVESKKFEVQGCNGHKVIIYGDLHISPCQHGGVEKMRKCILPV